MPRSLRFYRDILGFTGHMDSGDGDDSSWVRITKDGTRPMLNDQYEPIGLRLGFYGAGLGVSVFGEVNGRRLTYGQMVEQ